LEIEDSIVGADKWDKNKDQGKREKEVAMNMKNIQHGQM
jgi:hypothetical protein